jgi:SAM-dependent methyltransferase
MPSVADMHVYADHEYAGGLYTEYANSRHLKVATAQGRLDAIAELTSGKHLLDVGCATGFFLEAALERGYEVQGVEFSEVAISLARSDVRGHIICGDVNTLLAQKPGRFDVVTAFDIIEHVQDPASFVREIRDILVPGGLLTLSTPDTDHILRYVMRSRWPMLQPMQHTVLFSKRGIASLLESCGFDDVKVETTRKVLTFDYLGDQLAANNPILHRLFRTVRWIMPKSLRNKPFAVNIGELIAYARKPK